MKSSFYKNIIIRLQLACIFGGVLGGYSAAIAAPQGVEYPASVGVYVWAEVQAAQAGAVTMTAKSEVVWHLQGGDSQSTDINLSASATDTTSWVNDGQKAWLPITTDEVIAYHTIAGSNLNRYRFHVVAPAGYDVYFYDPAKGYYCESAVLEAPASTNALLFFVKPHDEQGGLAGKAQDIMPGETNLRIALGYLPNGESAGYLDFSPQLKLGGRDALGGFFLFYNYQVPGFDGVQYRLDLPGRAAGPFYCNATSDQVKIIYESYTAANGATNRRIKQVITPQALIDITGQNSGASQTVRFFSRSASFSPDSSGGFTPSGTPFVQYEMVSGSSSTAWNCDITRTEGNWVTHANISSNQKTENVTVQQMVNTCTQSHAVCVSYITVSTLNSYPCTYWQLYLAYDYYYGYYWSYQLIYTTCYYIVNTKVCDRSITVCDSTVQQPQPVTISLATSRNETQVNGFSDSRTETAVSYNSLYPSTTHFNGDSFNASRSGSSMTLVGRYGADRAQHAADPLNPYSTPYFTSAYETVFALQGDAANLDSLNPDFASGAIGYTTHRKYCDAASIDNSVAKPHPGRLFSEERPDRSWSVYGYHTSLAKVGLVSTIATPYLDTGCPSSVPDAGTAGYRIETIDYAADWNGAVRLPGTIESWVNGTKMSVANYSYSALARVNGQPVWQAVSSVSSTDSNVATVRTVKIYQGQNVDPLYRDQPFSITEADGSKRCFAYERGYLGADGSFTADSAGLAMRTIAISGTSAGTTTSVAGCSQTLDQIGLVAGASISQGIIRDWRGLMVRNTQSVYDGTNWQLVAWTNFTYDPAGNLLRRETSSGGIYEAEYTDVNGGNTTASSIAFTNSGTPTGRIQYERDERGVVTKYEYDSLGRTSATVRLALPASGINPNPISALRTSFVYNADSRLVEKRIGSPDAEQIVCDYQYDFSGRLTAKTEDGLTTHYTYNLQNGQIQSVTETRPDNSTVDVATYRDGSIKSKTGSGIIPVFYSYGIDGARETVTTHLSSATSARTSTTWLDGLGRTLKQRSAVPAPGAALDTLYSYNEKNQLLAVQSGGLAPMAYIYDSLGRLSETGTDFNNDGILGVSDRKSKVTSDLRHDPGAWSRYSGDSSTWWKYSEVRAFPDNSTDGQVQTRTWTRLSNFTQLTPPTGVTGVGVAETIQADANGNRSVTQVFVNRAASTTTTVEYSAFATKPAISIALAGLPVSQTTSAGVTTASVYDELGRLVKTVDRTSTGRLLNNVAYYPGTTRIQSVADNLGVRQHLYVYDSAGRLATDLTPRIVNGSVLGLNAAYFAYNSRGQLTYTWGNVPYPAKYEYDAYGDCVSQYTYRDPNINWAQANLPGEGWPASGDKTTFTYYPETGQLYQKTDAANQTWTYTYNSRGQVSTFNSARNITTTYGYNDTTTGELATITYSDTTPAVAYAYDRLGRLRTVHDATGDRTFTYRANDLQPDAELLGRLNGATTNNLLGTGRQLTNHYDPTTGRFVGFSLDNGNTTEHAVSYAFDAENARLHEITSGAGSFDYTYLANSDLVSGVSRGQFVQTRTYEGNRDLLHNISSYTQAGRIAAYTYTHDLLGRRTMVEQTGLVYFPYSASGELMRTAFGYDDRDEVTSSVTTVGSTTLPGRSFGYSFDSIGNRRKETIGATDYAYVANALNQYDTRATPSYLPVTGMANHSGGATLTVSGNPTVTWKNNFFYAPVSKAMPSAASSQTVALTATSGGQTQSDNVWTMVRPTSESFTHDADGNLTNDALWVYRYDAEDRLYSMHSVLPDQTGHHLALFFTYDYMGRRVSKQVFSYDGDPGAPTNYTTRSTTYFAWQDRTLLAEYDEGMALVRRYTIGLDLSGSLGGAGDVGGLLAIEDLTGTSPATYLAVHDGNGNLTALASGSTGDLAAAYEYDPFGNTLQASGSYGQANPIRFSGKYYDVETGLYNYGFRYYAPTLGRFINRDPLEEGGGLNLYALASNDPVGSFDPMGLSDSISLSYGGNYGNIPVNYVSSRPRQNFDFSQFGYSGPSPVFGFGGQIIYFKPPSITVEPLHISQPSTAGLSQTLSVHNLGSSGPNNGTGPYGFDSRNVPSPIANGISDEINDSAHAINPLDPKFWHGLFNTLGTIGDLAFFENPQPETRAVVIGIADTAQNGSTYDRARLTTGILLPLATAKVLGVAGELGSASVVFDARAGVFIEAKTGRILAPQEVPWPSNRGFASSKMGELKPGEIVDRYGNPSGRYAGKPGATTGERGMAPGTEKLPYQQYEVLKPLPAEIGPASRVKEFGAEGGATQYRFNKTIEQLVQEGYLRPRG